MATEAPHLIELKDKERTRCEVWTRVMGYYRPISAWNAGKQSEQAERLAFREPPAAMIEPTGQMKLGV
ncbi:MAG: anaerobic ribonucleoside-triphosphate reductase [Armatimonadetes bacterium]|nr:anaerobic ribonucleoside-triphosphate reductase [Armatimonadota bacterium]